MGLINEREETKKMLNILREFDETPIIGNNEGTGETSIDADESDVSEQNQSIKQFISDGVINNITIHKDNQGVGIGATVYGKIISMNSMPWMLTLNTPGVSNGVKIMNGEGDEGENGLELFDLNRDNLDKLSKLFGWGENFLTDFSKTLDDNYSRTSE